MARVLLLQGPNMSFLGRREPELYGSTTAAELDAMMREAATARGVELEIFYTHVEGEAIGRIYEAEQAGVDGLLMNPAGFIYAGYALRDCLRAARLPYVEVHITNIERRGIHSLLAAEADGLIIGLGVHGYVLGLDALLHVIGRRAAG
jgi:3-dehydroquinate dehydratase-2